MRAHEIFGVTGAVVVTRTTTCAGPSSRALGRASTPWSRRLLDERRAAKAVVYRVREVPASLKAAWDAVTHREPVHLGAQESAVTDVLDSLAPRP
ncbi:hypothetical protein NKG05_05005 [Oerskovia sp. M15]